MKTNSSSGEIKDLVWLLKTCDSCLIIKYVQSNETPKAKLVLIVIEVLSFRSRCKVEKYISCFSPNYLKDQPVLMETNNCLKMNRINKQPVSVLYLSRSIQFPKSQLLMQTIQINLIQLCDLNFYHDDDKLISPI